MKKTFTNVFILFFFTLSLSVFAQDANVKRDISGVVVDASGVPLPGVNVIEKNTNNGVVTDFDGKYQLKVGIESTVVFSFIGMKTQEISVKGKTDFNITLQEDTAALDEVVVVGYGTQKREAVTGAVETIKGEEIEDLPVGNLASALVGRVLGVSVSGGNARPGQAARITIRQPNTPFSKDGGTTDPLYVIDGILQIDPVNGNNDSTLFNNLDASEVESISFLKDASAAIYGSRAANGVVLVTTKKGKKGPAKFSYSGNFSVSDSAYKTEMLNASQYADVFTILNGPNGRGRLYDPENFTSAMRPYFFTPNEMDYYKEHSYDHLENNWTSASTQRHNLNITGGSENATYFAGMSYYTQDGNLGTLNYDRWSFRSGSSVNLSRGLTANFQVSGFFTDVSKTFSKIGSENNENDYRQLINRAPFLPMYVNDLPVMLFNGNTGDDLLGYHYEEIQRLQNLSTSADNNVSFNIDVEYEVPFIEGLKFKANYARQESNGRGEQKGNRYSLYQFNAPTDSPLDLFLLYEDGVGPLGENTLRREDVISNGDRILISHTKTKREQTRFQATYDRTFGLHNVSAFFAVEKAESRNDELKVIKFGAPDWGRGMLWEATGSLDPDNTYNWRRESGELGYIGRFNYNYDGKYYAEFLFRSDASAKFAPENYWGNFFSISGGWIISKEDFFKSNTIDYLKFRGSVGLLGKDDARAWKWRQNYENALGEGAVFGGNGSVTSALEPGSPANPDIKWSDELKTNFGFEAKFLDHRLSTSVETYYNIGTNLLDNLTEGVPFTVGGGASTINYSEYDAWGTEISIGWSDNVGEDFSYSANFNIGWGNNKRIKGNFADPSVTYPWTANQPGNTDIGTWGWDYQGMFKSQEEIDNYIAETGITNILGINASNLKPGMLYYRDVRGPWDPETRTFGDPDGVVDTYDQIRLRKPAKGPQGFATSLRLNYKQLSLSTVLSVNWGGYRRVGGSAINPLDNTLIFQNFENKPVFWSRMYDPEFNPSGTIPNLYDYQANEDASGETQRINTVNSEFWRVSSFSLLMRNINLSYSLPKKVANKIGFNSLRLNVVAINPFILFNPYKDYGLTPYGSYDNYPELRTYSLGLNVGF